MAARKSFLGDRRRSKRQPKIAQTYCPYCKKIVKAEQRGCLLRCLVCKMRID